MCSAERGPLRWMWSWLETPLNCPPKQLGPGETSLHFWLCSWVCSLICSPSGTVSAFTFLPGRLRNLSCASMEKWTWCFPLISPVIFLIHDSKSWIVPVALRKRLVSGCPANRLTQNCLGKPDRYACNCRHRSVQVLRHPDRFQKSR